MEFFFVGPNPTLLFSLSVFSPIFPINRVKGGVGGVIGTFSDRVGDSDREVLGLWTSDLAREFVIEEQWRWSSTLLPWESTRYELVVHCTSLMINMFCSSYMMSICRQARDTTQQLKIRRSSPVLGAYGITVPCRICEFSNQQFWRRKGGLSIRGL
ncbi:hypothetical protein MLD38_025746 [Melastoma candidum]|uniref:Uncharacterized protein n=1 Tax=Melastoma candidum TaxID=119954 RepID=A0ACB9NY56_9MYRT|nr:hypothetical protein MLD38_025746 [Melastoma candidum]